MYEWYSFLPIVYCSCEILFFLAIILYAYLKKTATGVTYVFIILMICSSVLELLYYQLF